MLSDERISEIRADYTIGEIIKNCTCGACEMYKEVAAVVNELIADRQELIDILEQQKVDKEER